MTALSSLKSLYYREICAVTGSMLFKTSGKCYMLQKPIYFSSEVLLGSRIWDITNIRSGFTIFEVICVIILFIQQFLGIDEDKKLFRMT